MTAVGQELPAGRSARPPQRTAAPDDQRAALARSIRSRLEDYLDGRRLVTVKIREAKGKKVEGFLKIDGGKGERLLVDFKATATPQGGLSSLEVGGRKVSLALGSRAKRAR